MVYYASMWLTYALFSAIFAALVAIFGKLGLSKVDSTLATTIRSIIMAVFLLVISLSLEKFKGFTWSSFNGKQWLYVALAGVAGALSWLFYFSALKNGAASKVAAIDRLSVVFVFVLAVLFLGETLKIKSVLGAVMIAGGAMLMTLK